MHGDLVLGQAQLWQRLTRGDSHLTLDQVDIGDFFGDRVLDLNARVHLDEDVFAGVWADGVNQEFDGSSVLIADCSCEGYRVTI